MNENLLAYYCWGFKKDKPAIEYGLKSNKKDVSYINHVI